MTRPTEPDPQAEAKEELAKIQAEMAELEGRLEAARRKLN